MKVFCWCNKSIVQLLKQNTFTDKTSFIIISHSVVIIINHYFTSFIIISHFVVGVGDKINTVTDVPLNHEFNMSLVLAIW